MATGNTGGLKRLCKATVYSWQGLKAAFKKETAFRQEVYLSIFMIPAGIWLGETGTERALLAGSVFLVLIIELINSGLEAVVDRFGEDHHELSGLAKDTGSAAVLVALVNVLVIWTLVLFF